MMIVELVKFAVA